MDLNALKTLLNYSDRMNSEMLNAAEGLDDEALDKSFDMGRGTLRLTLTHIWAGESVWLARWQGKTETPWPNELEEIGVGDIRSRLEASSAERRRFVEGLTPDAVTRTLEYRDSKGGLFRTTLADMMMQMCIHSIHHRAQAVNMIRRAGGASLEMDYMTSVRQEA